jgi:coenzyme F420-reducing hydrogenase beta subunit
MEEFSFDIKTIVDQNLCTGCGICVSEDPANLKMEWDEYGFLVPHQFNSSNSTKGIKVCPFNPSPEEEVKDEDKLADIFLKTATNKDSQIGKYINTYVGFSNEYRITSSSGGIATYIFEQLLKLKIVDYLYIVKEVDGTYEYQLFEDFNNIREISKTRYIPVTLDKLFNQINLIDGKIAVSGVACFIKAIRLKQHYNPELKNKIPFLVGIICGGLKSKHYSDYLAQRSGIQNNYFGQDYRAKNPESNATDYSFKALDEKDDIFKIRMKELGDLWGSGLFKANACDFCDDVTTELADISLGDAWLKPYSDDGLGNSVIVTRSFIAEDLIKNGIKKNELNIELLDISDFKKSQQGSFNHRQNGLWYRINEKRKQNKLVPQKRERFYRKIPFFARLVQKQRMKTRAYSHTIWNDTKNAVLFEKKMYRLRKRLSKLTLYSHRMTKIGRIIKKSFK